MWLLILRHIAYYLFVGTVRMSYQSRIHKHGRINNIIHFPLSIMNVELINYSRVT
jgi:hypothetical protein